MSDILNAREKRALHINELMNTYKDKTIVIIKLNVPGVEKNPRNMGFICRYYYDIVNSTFDSKIVTSKHVKSLDGDYMFFIVSEIGKKVKEKTILIEEQIDLGRLIDIDVYNESAINRSDLLYKNRKCIICDDYAYNCVRSKKHCTEEIHNRFNEIINEFLLELLTHKAVTSMYSELNLFPKFGLVSKQNNGCHKDMNSITFTKSIEAIKPFLKEFILYGIYNENEPLKLQRIGLKAESAMFKATNNINTHKGLIFALGVFLPSITKAILKQDNLEGIQKEVKYISKVVIGDYYKFLQLKTKKTHGDEIYLSYNLKGIRGEALDGFKVLHEIPSYNDVQSTNTYHEYLIHLMSVIDDTTIIHKTNIETLREVKLTFSDLVINGGYTNNQELVKSISIDYINRNISPGGSADLLVLKIIFEELRYLLK